MFDLDEKPTIMTSNPSNPLVQLANSKQASDIAAVLRHAFAEYEPLYTAKAFAATTPTPEQIRNRWSEGPVWLVIQTEDIVGTVAAVPKPNGVYVRSMAILPEARGNGLGVLLLGQVESYSQQIGIQRIFLSTTLFLHRAIRLYEHFGFKRTPDGPHTLHDTPLFTMEKILAGKGRSHDK